MCPQGSFPVGLPLACEWGAGPGHLGATQLRGRAARGRQWALPIRGHCRGSCLPSTGRRPQPAGAWKPLVPGHGLRTVHLACGPHRRRQVRGRPGRGGGGGGGAGGPRWQEWAGPRRAVRGTAAPAHLARPRSPSSALGPRRHPPSPRLATSEAPDAMEEWDVPQMKKEVESLKYQLAFKREMSSKTIPELLKWIEDGIPKDPFLNPDLMKNNPWVEKGKCAIL
uniref:Guanine nucleotide-binding protein G(I)/G(S)/G(O) subunit gamma-13 n=1 Tax=Canis lupus familiaris TaxID=9615 RepID=A0A8C0N9D8_CANLF